MSVTDTRHRSTKSDDVYVFVPVLVPARLLYYLAVATLYFAVSTVTLRSGFTILWPQDNSLNALLLHISRTLLLCTMFYIGVLVIDHSFPHKTITEGGTQLIKYGSPSYGVCLSVR